VTHLRGQRIGMVQSLDQFAFIHDVLSEIINEREGNRILNSSLSIVYDGSVKCKKEKKKRKSFKLKT